MSDRAQNSADGGIGRHSPPKIPLLSRPAPRRALALRNFLLSVRTEKSGTAGSGRIRVFLSAVRTGDFAHAVRLFRCSFRTGNNRAAAVWVKGVGFRAGTAIQFARPARNLHFAVAGAERNLPACPRAGVPHRPGLAQDNGGALAVRAGHINRRRRGRARFPRQRRRGPAGKARRQRPRSKRAMRIGAVANNPPRRLSPNGADFTGETEATQASITA